jgi:hypothetical protein
MLLHYVLKIKAIVNLKPGANARSHFSVPRPFPLDGKRTKGQATNLCPPVCVRG